MDADAVVEERRESRYKSGSSSDAPIPSTLVIQQTLTYQLLELNDVVYARRMRRQDGQIEHQRGGGVVLGEALGAWASFSSPER